MAIHLRQICLVASELAPHVDTLRAVFGWPVAHVDANVGKWGLENTLLTVGTQFLEIVVPTREDTAAGRYIDRRGGDGGYMVICQVPSLEEQNAVRARAAAAGVREAYFGDRGDWNVMQLHPADMRATFFEVDWDIKADPEGRWMPAGGTEWQDEAGAVRGMAITAADIQTDDPRALAEHWSKVSGLPVGSDAGTPAVRLANAVLRFVPARDGRGPGLGGIEIAVPDRTTVLERAAERGVTERDGVLDICGTRIAVVSA